MKPAIVVEWQSPQMPAPAFWYYANREHADRVGFDLGLRPGYRVIVHPTEVPDNACLLDEPLP